MKLLHTTLLLLLLSTFTTIAQDTKPILRLNTEMHTAKISRLDVDPVGKYILTCSRDKVAKLWDANTGDLLQTFRVPIGKGDNGMLYAGAIHPDGNQVAVGGWSKSLNHDIYIFDIQSAEIIHRISKLPNVVQDLEYAPSGRYLAATLGTNNGIRIYRSKTYNLYKTDSDYEDNTNNAAFDQLDRLVTASYDGYVRLYDANFNLIKKVQPIKGKRPYSVAFSPDGDKIAVGFNDVATIKVLNGRTLSTLYEPDVSEANSVSERLNKVCFSYDGKKLFAGGFLDRFNAGSYWYQIRVWEDAGRGNFNDYNGGNSTIMDIKPLKDGSIAFCSHNPDLGILSATTGSQKIFKYSDKNRYGSGSKSHFKLSEDGYTVSIKPYQKKALTFDLNQRKILEKATDLPEYEDKWKSINISDWNDSTKPKLNGKALSFLRKYERSYAVDIASNASRIIFGAAWDLYCLNADSKTEWEVPLQSIVWCVNISDDNRIVTAGLGDGTIRWHRLSDGEQLLTLFMHPDNKRWVIWTPSGYYDASPGAEDLIGWHVNRSADEAALFYPFSKFRYQYYRPDVIDRVLETLDVEEAVKQANEIAERFGKTRTRNIVDELPPTIKIINPATGTTVSSSSVTIEYNIQSPNNEEITGIRAMVNGRPVSEKRGLKAKGTRGTMTIPIPAEDCRVSVIAENRFGTSEQANIRLKWAGSTTRSSFINKPNLYVLAIGVSDYNDSELKLNFAAKDARDFKNAIDRHNGRLYGSAEYRLLTNSEATRANIMDGLEWIVKQTTQHDVAMIFFAGHGRENSRGTFYYVPVEADLSDGSLRRSGIMREDIKETVATIVGKVLVFMDACHSGNLMESSRRRGTPDLTRIINELADAENGAITFSSSSGRQYSLEDSRWNNGAFTKAVVEGLNGEAANNDGSITWKSLDAYVTRRVKKLTNGDQSAVTAVPPDTEDYPIGIKP
ncbi:MAG: caspase family protein [Bacteroidota bacterium]